MESKSGVQHQYAHALPYGSQPPDLYRYPDGCTVRKSGDGAYALHPYDSDPLPSHTESDFIPHPDTPTDTETNA